MGKRNQLSITLQWGYNNSIVGEETFIDKTGRTSKEFFRFYKNDLFGRRDNQPPFYPRKITQSNWGEKLQPYFKHAINEKAYTYTLILTDEDVDVGDGLFIRSIHYGEQDYYTLFQWWNKESREGGIEIVENNPNIDKLGWRSNQFYDHILSESERQRFYPLFDHRDRDPRCPQEFFIERLQKMLGTQVGNMPISNDNYYTLRYLRWVEGFCQLTLGWGEKGKSPDPTGPKETQLVECDAERLADRIGIQPTSGIPGEGYWSFTGDEEKYCIENAYRIVQFDHQVDFDKYSYTILIDSVIVCFA